METTASLQTTPFIKLMAQEGRFGRMDYETHGGAASTDNAHPTSTVQTLARLVLLMTHDRSFQLSNLCKFLLVGRIRSKNFR
jgi:hypothetical protein